MLQNLLQDIHYAWRQFQKRPAFTITAVVILALGLGANTAIFSVVNAFLLRPLPYPQSSRLAALYERDVVEKELYNWVAPGTFLDWQKLSTSFDSMSAYTLGPVNLSSPSSSFEPERIVGCACSANLFSTLGASPFMGRGFQPDEDRYGGPRVAVISYSLWQQRFGGARDIIGRQIRMDGENAAIIGVMPAGFGFPQQNVQVWSPLLSYVNPQRQLRHDTHFLRVIARLRPGVNVDQAKAEIDGISSRYKRAHPDEVAGKGANAIPLHEDLVRRVRTSLLLLLAAVCCVLLIACVNVANLLLTRTAGRTREVSIRAAIGASRQRILSQLLTESVLLSLVGGLVGVLVATSTAELLVARAPGADTVMPGSGLSSDPLVFLFAFTMALVTGVAAGLFPAIQSSRTDVAAGLKDVSRSSTSSRTQGRFRSILVTVEVALSLVLLIAAGLLLRSFSRLFQVSPGVRVDHTLTMAITVPTEMSKVPAKEAVFLRQLTDRMQTLRGVQSAGLVSCAPVAGHCDDLVFHIQGRPLPPGQMFDALDRGASPGYFAAAGIPLVRGRTFRENDDDIGYDPKHPRMGEVIISEAMAKRFFPNEDPIGKRIYFDVDIQREKLQGDPVPLRQIVGVVGDVLPALDQRVTPTVYTPLPSSYDEVYVVLHTSGEPHTIARAAEAEIHKLAPDLAVFQVRTMEEIVGRSASDREFSIFLFGSFAALALLLAAVGLYAVLSYAVSQRKGEIGIRMALGASGSDVSGWVLREGMKPALAGTLLGLAGAAFATRALASLLFEVTPLDPVTFALVPLLLLTVAALASYVPAWRATRIDPTLTLRSE